MHFEVGETVVYPHHGAAEITEVKTRVIKGEEKLYLKLKVTQGDLVIEVPAENVDLVGVRDVIGREGVEQRLRRASRPVHRGAHQLVAPLQGEPREARLRRRHQGVRGRPRPVAPRPGPGALRRREADARQGPPDPDLRARARREDRRGEGRDACSTRFSHRRRERRPADAARSSSSPPAAARGWPRAGPKAFVEVAGRTILERALRRILRLVRPRARSSSSPPPTWSTRPRLDRSALAGPRPASSRSSSGATHSPGVGRRRPRRPLDPASRPCSCTTRRAASRPPAQFESRRLGRRVARPRRRSRAARQRHDQAGRRGGRGRRRPSTGRSSSRCRRRRASRARALDAAYAAATRGRTPTTPRSSPRPATR